jgi:hypothetical protein
MAILPPPDPDSRCSELMQANIEIPASRFRAPRNDGWKTTAP